GFLLLGWVDGILLRNLLLKGLPAVEAVVRAAEWLATLHRSGTRAGRVYTFQRQLHTLRGWAARMVFVCPAVESRLTGLLCRIEERADALSWAAGPTHRDFSPDHLLLTGGITTGIDFDEFCQYDPLFDVAHFMAHLGSPTLAHQFLAAYRAMAPDYSEERIAL